VADVRIANIDGSSPVDVAQPGDERAFAFVGDRAVFARNGHGGTLFSIALDGSNERALTGEAVDAKPGGTTAAGDVLYVDAKGALYGVSARGGDSVLLDPSAGKAVRVEKIEQGRAFFTSGNILRAAMLDGTGAVSLCNEHRGAE